MIHYENMNSDRKFDQPFSVLMSVYYKERPGNLRVSLESILVYQTIKPTEIVLVKDGPLDSGLNSLIDKFIDQFPDTIKVVELSENKGLATALRVGLEECSYDIVARMDSDDISVENRFEKQLQIMETGKYDVVGSNTLYFDDETKSVIGLKINPETMERIIPYSKKRSPVSHVTAMFKKKSVLAVGSYENVLQFEDYWLWVKMIMAGMQIYNIQEPLVYVRYGDGMISRRGGKSYFNKELAFLRKLREVGFIDRKEYVRNLFIRGTVRFMPAKLRRFLYSNFLRSKVTNEIGNRASALVYAMTENIRKKGGICT